MIIQKTGTENTETPINIFDLLFKKDYDKINKEIDKLTFMDEIEDLYLGHL